MYLQEEQRELATENYGLAFHLAKKWMKKLKGQIEWDDILGLCNIGLCKAAATYDPERPAKFATYATHCINNEIRMKLRKLNRKTKKERSLSSFRKEDEDNSYKTTISREILQKFSVEDETEYSVQLMQAEQFIQYNTTEREKKMLQMLYQGCTQQQIADALDLTQGYISRELQDLRKRFKKYIKGGD